MAPVASLLFVVGAPYDQTHSQAIVEQIGNALTQWDESGVDLDTELLNFINKNVPPEPIGIESCSLRLEGNLNVELLINPNRSVLQTSLRHFLDDETTYKHLVHAGLAIAGSGDWLLSDSTFGANELVTVLGKDLENDAKQRNEHVPTRLVVSCVEEGHWGKGCPLVSSLSSVHFSISINPPISSSPSCVRELSTYISSLLNQTFDPNLEQLMPSSDLVGNIKMTRPTFYVFPAGDGNAGLFGFDGFTLLLDGGHCRSPSFWPFVRHLDRVDAWLLSGVDTAKLCAPVQMLRRKALTDCYPKIGHVLANLPPGSAQAAGGGHPLILCPFDQVSAVESGLKQIALKPHPAMWTVNAKKVPEPINLYYKVGHGRLDMFVLNPVKEGKEMTNFLDQWKKRQTGSVAKLEPPTSLAALIVWQPTDPEAPVTRILYPGDCPVHQIFDSLEKLSSIAPFLSKPVYTKAMAQEKEKPAAGAKAPASARKAAPAPARAAAPKAAPASARKAPAASAKPAPAHPAKKPAPEKKKSPPGDDKPKPIRKPLKEPKKEKVEPVKKEVAPVPVPVPEPAMPQPTFEPKQEMPELVREISPPQAMPQADVGGPSSPLMSPLAPAPVLSPQPDEPQAFDVSPQFEKEEERSVSPNEPMRYSPKFTPPMSPQLDSTQPLSPHMEMETKEELSPLSPHLEKKELELDDTQPLSPHLAMKEQFSSEMAPQLNDTQPLSPPAAEKDLFSPEMVDDTLPLSSLEAEKDLFSPEMDMAQPPSPKLEPAPASAATFPGFDMGQDELLMEPDLPKPQQLSPLSPASDSSPQDVPLEPSPSPVPDDSQEDVDFLGELVAAAPGMELEEPQPKYAMPPPEMLAFDKPVELPGIPEENQGFGSSKSPLSPTAPPIPPRQIPSPPKAPLHPFPLPEPMAAADAMAFTDNFSPERRRSGPQSPAFHGELSPPHRGSHEDPRISPEVALELERKISTSMEPHALLAGLIDLNGLKDSHPSEPSPEKSPAVGYDNQAFTESTPLHTVPHDVQSFNVSRHPVAEIPSTLESPESVSSPPESISSPPEPEQSPKAKPIQNGGTKFSSDTFSPDVVDVVNQLDSLTLQSPPQKQPTDDVSSTVYCTPDPETDDLAASAVTPEQTAAFHAPPSLEELKKEWGEPLGLPAPPAQRAPADKKKTATPPARSTASRAPARGATAATSSTSASAASRRSAPAASKPTATKPPASRPAASKPGPPPAKSAGMGRGAAAPKKPAPVSLKAPVYLDLAYIPSDANEDFFKLVRSRNYILSGLEPSKAMLDAFLSGKKAWGMPEAEANLVPTYDSQTLDLWIALNEPQFVEQKVDVKPSAVRCELSLEEGEASCATYRIEL